MRSDITRSSRQRGPARNAKMGAPHAGVNGWSPAQTRSGDAGEVRFVKLPEGQLVRSASSSECASARAAVALILFAISRVKKRLACWGGVLDQIG